MGFFSGSKPKVKEYPQTDWQKSGIDFLRSLLEGEAPLQQVAGLSPIEQMGQSQLQDFVSGGSFRDPLTSQYYQGMRGQLGMEEAAAVDALRRRSQMGGALNASPSYEAEGRTREGYANQRMSLLGQLYNLESARDNPLTRAQAAMSLGSVPRLLEQAQLDALMQQSMFPYQTQAPIAQSLMEHQPTLYMQPGSQSGLSQGLGYAGGLTSILGGLAMAGGPYGFNWWSRGSPSSYLDRSYLGGYGAPGNAFSYFG